MTLKQYLSQNKYFSESQQEFVEIDSLPWLRAYYSFRKLMTSYPKEFPGTTLYHEFDGLLSPTRDALTGILGVYGEASCAYQVYGDRVGLTRKQARDRLYRAAKYAGCKVKTHDTQWDSRGGNFITATTVAPETTVRIKGRALA